MKSPISLKLLVIGLAVVAASGLLLVEFIKPNAPAAALSTTSPEVNSGTAAVSQQPEQAPKSDRSFMRNPFAPDPASLAVGQALFEENCTSCHGFSGRGDGRRAKRLAIPPADLIVHIPQHADIELFRLIRDGKSFTPMPSFGDTFTTEEIWHLVNYLRAFEVNQSLAEDYYRAGLDFATQADYEQAVDSFNAAIKLSPKYALAYNSRGIVFRRMGEFGQAIADHSRVIELKPKFTEAYFNRAVDFHASRDLARAILDYNQAIALGYRQPDAYYARGLAYEASGDLARAMSDFDQALALQPDYTLIYLDRGLAHYHRGNLEKALSDLEQYLERAPEAPDRPEVTGLVAEIEAELAATQSASGSTK